MGQDRGLMDSATPHCESCSQTLERAGGADRWECVNPECPRKGEPITIAT